MFIPSNLILPVILALSTDSILSLDIVLSSILEPFIFALSDICSSVILFNSIYLFENCFEFKRGQY